MQGEGGEVVLFCAEKHAPDEVGRGDAWSAFDDFEASEGAYDAVAVFTGGIWGGGEGVYISGSGSGSGSGNGYL